MVVDIEVAGESGAGKLRLVPGSFYQFGTGSYTSKDKDGKDVRGKSDLLNIWKKDDKGVWNIHLEMWWGSDSDEVKDVKVFADIDARTAELTTAWNSEDYEAVLAMFDEGFLLISGVAKPIGDRDAHRKQLALEVKEYPSVHYKTNTLKVNGKLAYAIGVETFTFTGEDGKDTTGKDDFLIVWKKDDKGIWNIHLEFWWDIGSDE